MILSFLLTFRMRKFDAYSSQHGQENLNAKVYLIAITIMCQLDLLKICLVFLRFKVIYCIDTS